MRTAIVVIVLLVITAILAVNAYASYQQPIRPYPVSEHGTKLLVNKGHRLVPFPISEHRAQFYPRPISEH